MPSIESRSSFSSSILGNTITKNLSQEGASLEIGHIAKGKNAVQWVVKTPSQKKSRALVKIKNVFLHFFRTKQKSPGIALYNDYLQFLQKKHAAILTDKKSQDTLRFKTQAAFILSGVCQLKKKNNQLAFTKTTTPITHKVIEQLNHLTSCSPLRLTYEFIAQNKIPPKGYLKKILQPFLVDFLLEKDPSLDIKKATLIVKKECKNCFLLKEKDISLEALLEIKTRLSSFSQKNTTDRTHTEKKHQLMPIELDPPKPSLKYHCDEDDIWLIQHHVKNSRRIRIVKDMFVRAYRWQQRNKRTVFLECTNNAFFVLASGLITGGIGAAAGLFSVAFFTLLDVTISKIGGQIRQKLSKTRIKKWKQSSADFDENEQPHHLPKHAKKFNDFMNSCAYLVNEKTLSHALNGYANFEKDVKNLKKQHKKRNDSASERLRYEKLKALVDIRHNELKSSFSFSSITDSSSGSYDQFIVDTVTEISRLEDEYQNSFGLLWKEFSALPKKERLSLLNRAARKVHGKWYHSKNYNYHSLIEQKFKNDQNSIGKKIHRLVKSPPQKFSPILKRDKTKAPSRRILKRISKHIKLPLSIVSKFFQTLGFYVFSLKTLILQGRLVLNTPILYIPGLISWLIYDIGGCAIKYINKLCNLKTLKRIYDESQTTRFDQRAEVSKKEWSALHTEAKNNLEQCAKKLNKIRDEHQKAHKLLDDLKINQKLTPKERHYQFAKIILQRHELESELQGFLSGAVGQMHEATVQASWQQDQLFNALVEEDERS